MKLMSLKSIAIGLAIAVYGAAANAEALDGEKLFKDPKKGGCVACHGKDAKSPIMPQYPKLAGQNEAYLVQQLKDIQSGARNNGQTAAMKGIMATVSAEEAKAIADWLATQ